MQREANAVVRDGAPDAELEVRRTAFMRYTGQGHEIEVPVAEGHFTEQDVAPLRRRYEDRYAAVYGRHVPDMEIEIMNWAVVVSTGLRPASPPAMVGQSRTPSPTGSRPVHLGRSTELVDVPSFERSSLAPGDEIEGPALIIEPQTTTYVSPQFDARVDGASNIVLTRRHAPGS
jgi:N-methylhydantoinase A